MVYPKAALESLVDSANTTSETAKILRIIQNTLPHIEEILGVQPMTSQPMTVGENYNKARAEFWVQPASLRLYNNQSWEDIVARNQAIVTWCEDTYGPRGHWSNPECRWWTGDGKYIFHREADRALFVLRWS